MIQRLSMIFMMLALLGSAGCAAASCEDPAASCSGKAPSPGTKMLLQNTERDDLNPYTPQMIMLLSHHR